MSSASAFGVVILAAGGVFLAFVLALLRCREFPGIFTFAFPFALHLRELQVVAVVDVLLIDLRHGEHQRKGRRSRE